MTILAIFYGVLIMLYFSKSLLARLYDIVRCKWGEEGDLSEGEDPEDVKMREKIQRYQRMKRLREKQRQAVGRSKGIN